MAIEIIEVYRSREGTESLDDPSSVLMYVVTGTDDDTAVRTTVEATAPATYIGLPTHRVLWAVSNLAKR